MTGSLCNEQRRASLYIWEETHDGSFTSNKTSDVRPWRTDAPTSPPKQALRRAHTEECPLWSTAPCKERTPADRQTERQTDRRTSVDFSLHSPLDNLGDWKRFLLDAFDAQKPGATGELPGSEEGFIFCFRFFFIFFLFCVPRCEYFGIERFCSSWLVTRCPGEERRMAAWFTFTIAFSTTLITQVRKGPVITKPRRWQMETFFLF